MHTDGVVIVLQIIHFDLFVLLNNCPDILKLSFIFMDVFL